MPYLVRGGERFFNRPEVRQSIIALRQASTADRSEIEPALVPAVRQVLAHVGLTDEPPPAGALRDKWDSLLALVGVAEELADVQPDARLPELVAELEQRSEAQHAPTVAGVTLASLHAAKGLEWDAVFLVGLTDGTLPIQHAETPDEIEEERRLFYVGVTRARTRLAISWALARTEGGRRSRKRSRFLTGLAPESAPVGRSRAAGRCRLCGGPLSTPAELKIGRCANCPSTADPDLVEALRSWRKTTSSRRRRCRPSWCSPTPRCWPSPNVDPPMMLRCLPFRASVEPSWTLTVPTSSRSWPQPVRSALFYSPAESGPSGRKKNLGTSFFIRLRGRCTGAYCQYPFPIESPLPAGTRPRREGGAEP